MSISLRISDLKKVYKVGFIPKRIVAVDGVSLEVEKGEIFGLLGPNGAGKTTTIKCILSLVHPDSGTIELLGEPIPSHRAKANIGFLSESPYVYDFLSGREYLIFSGKLHGLDTATCRKKADELLELFHIREAGELPLKRYSKGMLQRVGLAQALIHDPEFLILDEPMSGLDPVGRKEVRDLLISLKQRGRTILFSSHILSDAEMLCDRVAILVNGKMYTTGKLDTLLKKVEGYEITISKLQQPVFDGIPHQLVTQSEFQMLLRVPSIAEVHALLELSRTHRFEIDSIVPLRKTLEELYLGHLQ